MPAEVPRTAFRPWCASLSLFAGGLIATGALALGWNGGVEGRQVERCVPLEDALAAWVGVVRDLVDEVPPRLLLGADGADPVLDAAVIESGMTRSCFEEAAAEVVRTVAQTADHRADEVIALSFETFPLPEGVEVLAFEDIPRAPITHALRDATDLVHELVARLRAPEQQRRMR